VRCGAVQVSEMGAPGCPHICLCPPGGRPDWEVPSAIGETDLTGNMGNLVGGQRIRRAGDRSNSMGHFFPSEMAPP
jgi:hypothetical protein